MAASSQSRSKPNHAPSYRHLCGLLKKWRHEAGLSQRELAKKLRMSPSMVAKSELGDRRIDPVEFVKWVEACDLDRREAIRQVKA